MLLDRDLTVRETNYGSGKETDGSIEDRTHRRPHLSIEEKYDEVRQLINIGKEKGYLLYDEVNELLPADITSSDELDDLFNTFGSAGIEVIDSDQKYLRDEQADRSDGGRRRGARARPDAGRARQDQRSRSACICARWARCRCSRARAKSRSRGASSAASSPSSSRSRARRWSRKKVIELGDQLHTGERTIRELVIFNDEEITDERIEERSQAGAEADRRRPQGARGLREARREARSETPKGATTRDKRKYRKAQVGDDARADRACRNYIRKIEFTEAVKRRLIDEMKDAVESVQCGAARGRRLSTAC